MSDILLSTLNARWAHAAFGLRYLMANLGPLQERAAIAEFDINQRPLDILESILAHNPRILGLGVYIWNVEPATQLVADLKRLRPDITIVLGGPEVSYETDQQEICRLADYTITGEADLAFADLCRRLLAGQRPTERVIAAELPTFASPADVRQDRQDAKSAKSASQPTVQLLNHSTIQLPYHLYTDHDLAHRVIYVEASRGCPFHCEFCLSSLDVPVRNVPLDAFLPAMQSLLDRGARRFKFVDRTFNLNLATGRAILQFFLDRYRPGLFLHFEMIPDRLPEALRELIVRFPPGALQFEVGIQTFNEQVAARISRRQNNAKAEDNLRFLRAHAGVHVHADLIAGLPGEDLASFAAGFDRLVALNPQEIQVGILKRLRGTPIVRHDDQWSMVYSPHAPYEVLQTSNIDFAAMQRLRRFARYWDLIANSGNFIQTTPLIWSTSPRPRPEPAPVSSRPESEGHGEGTHEDQRLSSATSPFHCFWRLTDWLYTRTAHRTHGIALPTLMQLLFDYLTTELHHNRAPAADALARDYLRPGRRDLPEFLRPHAPSIPESDRPTHTPVPPRQTRHLTS